MRVAFDGRCLADGPPTGVARAFLDALGAYAARGEADCVLLLPPAAAAPTWPGVRVVAAPRGALARQLQLPRLLRRLAADLLHSPVAAVPLGAPCPTVATLHDLPWLHPELGEPDRWRRRAATRLAVRAAAAVLAPSAATAADLRRWLGAGCPPVAIVPHGTAGPPTPPPPPAARHGPLLALGDDRPRKDRATVRQAHALARASAPDLPALRFIGPPDDFVSEPAKHALLRECRAVVQGSRFEGFGLPVLEAMAHGAPLVCSDIAAHRELAGDAALFAPPGDAAALAAALLAIHRDEPLRARLVARGRDRAAPLTPAATAERWAAIHRQLGRGSAGR